MKNNNQFKSKIKPLFFILPLSFILILVIYAFKSQPKITKIYKSPPINQTTFDQNPPYPIGFWVKKLNEPLSSGENLIFKVKFESDAQLPDKINYFQNGSVKYTLVDDGQYPDDISGDKKYACFKIEDYNRLKAEISSLQNNINNQGYVHHFTGHSGKTYSNRAIAVFNETKFDNGDEVEINALLIDAINCNAEIKLEKSLFITDLSIVEDQTRTYNPVTGLGNPNGIWTFGTLMSNIENGTHPDGFRGFMKDWIKNWTGIQIVNGQTIESRDFVIQTFIAPWLQKAQNNPNLVINESSWETQWNSTNASALKINSPFKLTAIVNRLDLRANNSYTNDLSNAGETRFIFTLVNPLTGEIPINPNQSGSEQSDGVGFSDWRGLNIIFEYGNIQTNACFSQQFAQEWLDLSDNSLPLGNASSNNAYKDALQVITNTVTSANSNTGKPNGSAINRIRTNEKLFAPIDGMINIHDAWEIQDWEFRQFEVDNVTNKLKLVPLTNNPPVTSNFAPNIQEDYSGTTTGVSNASIVNWIYNGHRLQVKNGNFNLPNNLLSVSGIVRREGAQFFGFDEMIVDQFYSTNQNLLEAKEIRQQLSLNTCVGCHAGETKTRFTHINPLKFGDLANYTGTIINGIIGRQDDAFYPWGLSDLLQTNGKNIGMTVNNNFPSVLNFDVLKEIQGQNFFQNISPFLTGRRRTEYLNSPSNNNWQDDELDFEVLNDNNLSGLFYVNDPSNGEYFGNSQKWGYNDLEMRKIKLCQLLNSNCSGNQTSISLISNLSFIPLPKGAH